MGISSHSSISLDDDRLVSGAGLVVSFQRTLRVPGDGREHPLPPTWGRFPVHSVEPFADRLPGEWVGLNHFFVPVYQREALWLAFDAPSWRPAVVKIGAGGVNAVSGEPWDSRLTAGRQDYVVCPPQLWVDGVNARSGQVRQFVATPLGEGDSIEAQLRGADRVGGIQLAIFEPKPGRFPDDPPDDPDDSELAYAGPGMGLGAGGFIVQKIYADPHGPDTWQPSPSAEIFVHLLDSGRYRDVTGTDPPATPIDAEAYVAAGLPWFEIYDEDSAVVPPAAAFDDVAGPAPCNPEDRDPPRLGNGVHGADS